MSKLGGQSDLARCYFPFAGRINIRDRRYFPFVIRTLTLLTLILILTLILTTTRANHRYKLRAIGASSTGLRYSFAVRTVSDWNQLPVVMLNYAGDAGDGFIQDAAVAYPLIGSGGRRN